MYIRIFYLFILRIRIMAMLHASTVPFLLYTHIINMLIYTYTYICRIHTDAMNTRRNDKDARWINDAGRLL